MKYPYLCVLLIAAVSIFAPQVATSQTVKLKDPSKLITSEIAGRVRDKPVNKSLNELIAFGISEGASAVELKATVEKFNKYYNERHQEAISGYPIEIVEVIDIAKSFIPVVLTNTLKKTLGKNGYKRYKQFLKDSPFYDKVAGEVREAISEYTGATFDELIKYGTNVVDDSKGFIKQLDNAALNSSPKSAAMFVDAHRKATPEQRDFLKQFAQDEYRVNLDWTYDEAAENISPLLASAEEQLSNQRREFDKKLSDLESRFSHLGENISAINAAAVATGDQKILSEVAAFKDDVQKKYNQTLESWLSESELSIEKLKIDANNKARVINAGLSRNYDVALENNSILSYLEKRELIREKDDIFQSKLSNIDSQHGDFITYVGYMTELMSIVDVPVDVVNDLMVIGNSIADLNKLVELSMLDGVATGDVVKLGIQVAFNLFSALAGEERLSPEQVILEYLKSISEQISKVRMEMHERFDAVDEKLDVILLTVVNGLDQVAKRQKISARQIIKNTRITLGTQYLVLNESNRVSNLLTDLSIGICEERLNSTLGRIPKTILDNCLFSVKKFVTESIYNEELPLNMTELAVSLNKDSQARSTNLLKEYRANLINTEVGEKLVSPELWYFWSNVYRRLLLHDIDYTIATLADTGLAEVKHAGDNISEFKRKILEDLSKVDTVQSKPHPLAELLSATDKAISLITDETMKGPAVFYTNNKHIRCIEMEFKLLKNCNRDTPVIQEGFPSALTGEGVAAISAAVPGVSDLLASGLAKLKYTNTFIRSKNGEGGRGLLGQRKKYRYSDTFRLTISIQPIELNIPPKIIGTLDYTVTGKRILTAGRWVAFSRNDYNFPKFCSKGKNQSCIVAGITKAISNTKTLSSVAPFSSTDRAPYIEYWNSLREEAGRLTIENIESNSKSAVIDDKLDNSNIYLAAILRFVFSENIEDNDVIYAFANDKIRMPLLSNILNVTKNNPSLIWKLDSVYESKKDEYIKYFKSLNFQKAVYNASLQDLLSDAIDSVSRTNEILTSRSGK